MNKILTPIAIIFLFGISSTKALAANFTNAYDAISNSHFSTKDENNQFTVQTAKHIINLTVATGIKNGSIVVLLPAATKTKSANDGQPDRGDEIISSGFDLNGLTDREVSCREVNGSSDSLIWQAPEVKDSSQTGSEEHEITCKFEGEIPAGSQIEIKLGSEAGRLINPLPIKNHKVGQADIYPLKILSFDSSGNIVDRIILKVALIDEASACTGQSCVGAIVGKYRFSLFGQTSPKAKVTLLGQTVKAGAVADVQGNFVFSRPSPLFAQEVCLIARDSEKRISPPVCLPPFPVNYDTNIGPVLMPPTLSTDKGDYYVGEEGFLTGQTLPETDVNLIFFKDERLSFLDSFAIGLRFIEPVEAYAIPNLKIRSDKKGFFSISIPTSQRANFNFFAQGETDGSPSPKSFTLNIRILPWLTRQFYSLLSAFSPLKSHFWEIFLFWLLLILTVYLIKRFLHPEKIAYLHHLYLLKLKPHREMVIWENNRALIRFHLVSEKTNEPVEAI